MLARLHRLKATAEQLDTGLGIVRDDLLPWARESDGYCGAIGLVDRASGQAILLTLWADEETRTKSAEAAERLSSIAALASGAERDAIENLDVSLIEIVPGAKTS